MARLSQPAGRSRQLNPLDRMLALLECPRDWRLLDWLCQQAGGRFTRETPLARLNRAQLLAICEHLHEDLHQLRAKP